MRRVVAVQLLLALLVIGAAHADNGCSPGFFRCRDGMCLSLDFVCDGNSECEEGEDEEQNCDLTGKTLEISVNDENPGADQEVVLTCTGRGLSRSEVVQFQKMSLGGTKALLSSGDTVESDFQDKVHVTVRSEGQTRTVKLTIKSFQKEDEGVYSCRVKDSPAVEDSLQLVFFERSNCELSMASGPCFGMLESYGFNSTSGECERFIYGGCLGNKNRFRTKDQCEKKCKPGKRPLCPLCGIRCEFGMKEGPDGCKCQCKTDPCDGHQCPDGQKCVVTQPQCETQPCPKQPSCQADRPRCPLCGIRCEFGMKEGPDGCKCQCKTDPCDGHKCSDGQTCVITKPQCESQPCPKLPSCQDKQTVCSRAPETGLCRAYFRNYFYNQTARECQLFTYGGCGGNKNNFETKALCERTCGTPVPDCPTVACATRCQFGLVKDSKGCETCECKDNPCVEADCDDGCKPEQTCEMKGQERVCSWKAKCFDAQDVCLQPKMVGPCRAAMPRFFYNVTSRTCEQFTYGGCRGNENNFHTKSDCLTNCLDVSVTQPVGPPVAPEECPQIYCPIPCDFGYKRDNRGCMSCICSKGACEGTSCPDGCKLEQTCTSEDSNSCQWKSRCFDARAACEQPMKVGSCKAWHRRYYFNSGTKKCEPFYYGGCQGNENQFENEQNCIDSCGATREGRAGPPGTNCQSLETCNIKCQYGYATDSKGCSTCNCREDPCKMSGCPSGCKSEWLCTTAEGRRSCDWSAECFDRDAVCREPRMVGTCRVPIPRYHYNHTTGKCEQFIGCDTNNNNFLSEEDCMKTCQGVGVEETKECKAVQCNMNCPYGLETDKYGCHICKCKLDPCLSTNCPGGQKCKAVYTQCLKPPCDMVGKCIAGNTCELAADKGPCKASLHRWYHNTSTERCERFIYGGCDGNDNNFLSTMDCESTCIRGKPSCPTVMCAMDPCPYGLKTDASGCSVCECLENPCKGFTCTSGQICKVSYPQCLVPPCEPVGSCVNGDICSLLPSPGNCRGFIKRWYYNKESRSCEEFTYTGCGSNDNNFMSKHDCQDTCGTLEPQCPVEVRCPFPCEHGYELDSRGCQSCVCKPHPCENHQCPKGQVCVLQEVQCVRAPCLPQPTCQDSRVLCSLPPEPGICRALIPRYFYNHTSNQCELFNYGGCRGNNNNFKTHFMCDKHCGGTFCKRLHCERYCPFGLARDENNCPLCKCMPNPCAMKSCSSRDACLARRVENCQQPPCPYEAVCRSPGTVCLLPKEPGRCRSSMTRYFYNKTSRTCQEFTYTGCNGNDNNFEHKEQCQSYCRGMKMCPMCFMMCDYGFEMRPDGCPECKCKEDPCKDPDVCGYKKCVVVKKCMGFGVNRYCDYKRKCIAPEQSCKLPEDRGHPECGLKEERYSYNPVSRKCQKFTWSGCLGNSNNFYNERQCNKTCGAVTGDYLDEKCPMVMCMMFCEFGFAKDERNCPICQCNPHPCETRICPAGHTCIASTALCDSTPCPVRSVCIEPQSACNMAPQYGQCNRTRRRFTYNSVSKQCEELRYGGCGGNHNNFLSQQECQHVCGEKVACKECSNTCDFGYVIGEGGCPTCQCKEHPCKVNTCGDKPCVAEKKCMGYGSRRECEWRAKCLITDNVCKEPMEEGDQKCALREWRYYYHEDKQKCMKFMYTGCGGNLNNFFSELECNNTCIAAPISTCAAKEFTCKTSRECIPNVYMCDDDDDCEDGSDEDEDMCSCNAPNDFECEEIFQCVSQNVTCNGKKDCQDGTDEGELCTRRLLPSECQEEKDPGTSGPDGGIRYFYASSVGNCFPFAYNGAGGNLNRFKTVHECLCLCTNDSLSCSGGPTEGPSTLPPAPRSSPCPELDCPQECSHGSIRDKDYCPTCDCHPNPCQETSCESGCKGEYGCSMKDGQRNCGWTPKCFNAETGCQLPVSRGTCAIKMIRFHYNTTSKRCERFTYGGCGANENNFETLADCQASCEARLLPAECQEEKDPGTSGPDGGIRYYYASSVRNCFPFAYNGAGGTRNQFKTLHECLCFCTNDSLSCSGGPTEGPSTLPPAPRASPCPELDCPQECSHGSIRDKDYCPTCDCHPNPCQDTSCESGCKGEYGCSMKDGQRNCGWTPKCFNAETGCQLPVSRGSCALKMIRFHYNTTSKRCERFTYGGCGANENNFETLADCQASCEARLLPAECQEKKDPGTLGPDQGIRYYYASSVRNCFPFAYNGAGGTRNQFKTLHECLCFCTNDSLSCSGGPTEGPSTLPPAPRASPCPELDCPQECSHGSIRDKDYCPTCDCHPNPCQDTSCESGCKGEYGCSMKDGQRNCGWTPKCFNAETSCQLPVSRGTCAVKMIRFHYNTTSKRCESFIYGGCGANENNFEVLADCQASCEVDVRSTRLTSSCANHQCPADKKCVLEAVQCVRSPCYPVPACKAQEDICTQPPEPGRCRAAIPRYFYNSTASRCQPFIYGGCGGNYNLFKTLQACSSTCGSFKVKDCGDMYCEKYCEFGLATDTNGCQICKCKPHPCMLIQCDRSETCILKKDASCTNPDCPPKPTCVSPVDICKQPKEVGPCRALKPRYYYNSRSSQCEQFNYGGCRGNENNFETEKECDNLCSSQKLCPVCAMMCPYGFPMKPDGCPECKCKEDPCKDPRVCHGSQMCVAEKTCKGFGMNKQCYWHHRCIQPGLTCLLGLEQGNSSCLQNQQRYYYDASSQTCKAFTYTGCHGNSNNFANMEECGRGCKNVKGKLDKLCPPARCFMFCEYGFARDERGCTQCKCNPHPCETRKCAAGQTCVLSSVKCKDRNCPVRSACVDASETCQGTAQYGSCKGTVRRMFYNISAEQCQPFTYSGCGGNHNNFRSTKECQETCAEDKRTPCRNICQNKCKYGYRLKENGCPTCECREDPCQVNSCGSGSYCVSDIVCRGYGEMRMCHAVAKCVSRTACSLPVMTGNPRCGPQEHLFYFNRHQGKCRPFMYSGCEGNSNSFYFLEDCNKTCIDHCPPVCRMWCPFGKKKNHKGCEVCQCKQHVCEDETCPTGQKCKSSIHCIDKARKYCTHKYECVEPSKVCQMKLDNGSCKMDIPRWFYNAASGKCENFTYGGCAGNKNNFYQQRECEETCKSIPTPRSSGQSPAGGLTGPKHVNLTSISYPMGCSVPRTPGLCIDQCVRDQDCQKGYSCCSNGCGHVCTRLQELKLPPPCYTALEEALVTAVYKPNVYLPRCDKDGFYEKIQCSDHLGVCWCVHPENGFRIAGTQVKGKPDCSGTEDEPVCPDGEDVHDCSPALCMKYPCMAHKGIWCRVNPCGNCSVEFYDTNNNRVVPKMDDLRDCQMKRSSMLVKKTVLPALGTSSMITMKHFVRWRQCCSHTTKDFQQCMWIKGDNMVSKKMKLAEDFDACTDTVSITGTPAPVITGVSVPQCNADLYSSSSYKYRQCQGGFCWCVTSNGTFVTGTMTLRNKCLKCGPFGREVGSSEVYTCPYGDQPHLTCQDACSKEKCIVHGEAKQYHCTADPCNSCRTTFRDDQGQAVHCNEIKPVQADMCALPRSFGTCQASITRWYYDSYSGTCRKFLYTGCGGNANNFLSLAECMLSCEAKTKHSCKGASVQNPECNNVCRFATCQMFPEALCVTNPCSCEPEFIHPKTGRAVNCSESVGLCERMQAHEMAVYMKEGQQAKPELQISFENIDVSKCDHSGDRFRPSQCKQGVCRCVDEIGKPTMELHAKTGSCSLSPVIKYRGTVVFVAKFSEHIKNGGTIGFSRVVTAKISEVGGIPSHLIRVVAMWGGKLRDDDVISVMIDIDIREGKTDHILSRVDVVERMIRKGMFSVSHRGEVVYADSNSTSHTYARHSKHDTKPVKMEKMENKDLVPTIAVAASAAGIVLLIILGLCCFVWCRSGKKKEEKEFAEVGTN